MENKLVYIVGAFFQPHNFTKKYNHFFCVINDELSGLKQPVMKDGYGESTLFDLKFDESFLSFTKKYDHRKDLIKYSFQKKDEFWIGTYEGNEVGRGNAFCHLVFVENKLF